MSFADVYGHRQGHVPNQKDLSQFPPTPPGAVKGIMTSDNSQHGRFRRLLSHAFSARALEEQEGLVTQYVHQLIAGLKENASKGAQDMVAWFNWTTFDVMLQLPDISPPALTICRLSVTLRSRSHSMGSRSRSIIRGFISSLTKSSSASLLAIYPATTRDSRHCYLLSRQTL